MCIFLVLYLSKVLQMEASGTGSHKGGEKEVRDREGRKTKQLIQPEAECGNLYPKADTETHGCSACAKGQRLTEAPPLDLSLCVRNIMFRAVSAQCGWGEVSISHSCGGEEDSGVGRGGCATVMLGFWGSARLPSPFQQRVKLLPSGQMLGKVSFISEAACFKYFFFGQLQAGCGY